MNKITIKDLARLLNISISTVSRALSDHRDISPATKERVKTLAKELNYTTNLQAKLFRKQNSGLIALVLPEMNMFFTPRLIEGINKTLSKSNFTLITFISKDLLENEKEIINRCIQWNVEGVLISLSAESSSIEHLQILKNANIECVLLDKTSLIQNDEFTAVGIDGAAAAFDAATELIKKGHRDIIGIFGNPSLSITQNRVSGFKQALSEKSIPADPENIIQVEKATDLDFILPHILKHNKNITALFAMSDELLAAAHHHILQAGKVIPQDLSVIAISDGVYPYLLHPKISHIKHSGYRLGRKSSSLLFDHIEDNKNVSREIIKTKRVLLDSIKQL